MNKKDFDCSISHVHKWMTLFIFMYNAISKSDIKPSKINNWFDSDLNQGEPSFDEIICKLLIGKKDFFFYCKLCQKVENVNISSIIQHIHYFSDKHKQPLIQEWSKQMNQEFRRDETIRLEKDRQLE